MTNSNTNTNTNDFICNDPLCDCGHSKSSAAIHRLWKLNGGKPARSKELDKLAEEVVKFQKELIWDEQTIKEVADRLGKEVAEFND